VGNLEGDKPENVILEADSAALGRTSVGDNEEYAALLSGATGRRHIVTAGAPLPKWKRILIQCLIVVALLVGWQFLPTVSFLSDNIHLLNSFYVSSPSHVYSWIVKLMVGAKGTPEVWPYLYTTVMGAVVGSIIGVVTGALAALIFSESRSLSEVTQPFIVVANSVPRIALIPIVVLLVGPTLESSIVSVILVVFFLAFFNALEGGRSVRQSMIENSILLGASRWQIMRDLRAPNVILWTFAVVPNAISFGIVVAVTNELLTGLKGMGALLLTATTNLEAGLTFAVIVILSVVGVILYGVAELGRRKVLRWLS